MAGQLATASFDHQHPQAPDNRMQRSNLNERNEISPWIRWEGMQVYVVHEQKTYQLVGGTGNEHWQEIAAGGGASNFVGQFPTFEDLPDSGSPGDYAYVGTGDDFVQYNWDQIAGEWRLNSAETKVSDEDFFLGRVPSEPDRVMFSMRRNSIIYSAGGTQSISPDRMANYVFTGENITLENVNYSGDGGEEFHITNRTGSNLTILSTGNFASGLTIPAGHMASFKSSDDGWVQSFVNEEYTFSDTLDSVNAKISVGPDGKEVLSGVFDRNTGGSVEFKEYGLIPEFIDGIVFFEYRGKLFKRIGELTAEMFGAVPDDENVDNTEALQAYIDACVRSGQMNVRIDHDYYIMELGINSLHSGINISGKGTLIMLDGPVRRRAIYIKDENNDIENITIDINVKGFSRYTLDGEGDRPYNQSIGQDHNGITAAAYPNGRIRNIKVTCRGESLEGTLVHFDGVENGEAYVTGYQIGTHCFAGAVMNFGANSTWPEDFNPSVKFRVDAVNCNTAFDLGTTGSSKADMGNNIPTAEILGVTMRNQRSNTKVHGFWGVTQSGTIDLKNDTRVQGLLELPAFRIYNLQIAYYKGNTIRINGFWRAFEGYSTTGVVSIQNLIIENCMDSMLCTGRIEINNIELNDVYVVSEIALKSTLVVDNFTVKKVRRQKWVNELTAIQSQGYWADLTIPDVSMKFVSDGGKFIVNNQFTISDVGEDSVGDPEIDDFFRITRDNTEVDLRNIVTSVAATKKVNNLIKVHLDGTPWVTKVNIGRYTELEDITDNSILNRTRGILVSELRDVIPSAKLQGDVFNFSLSRQNNRFEWIDNTGNRRYNVNLPASINDGELYKATTEQVWVGVDDTKFITPLMLKNRLVRENKESSVTNYNFSTADDRAYLIFTSSVMGNANILLSRFQQGDELMGEVRGAAKVINPDPGINILSSNPNLIIPTGSYFYIRFTTETDAVLVSSSRYLDINRGDANYTLSESDGGRYLRFTGASGGITIPEAVFFTGDELQGEIEGGAKTFVAGAGVTLRYPAGGTNVAPTNSRFFIKFKSPNDAQLTIVPSVIPENTYDTFIPAIKGNGSDPTLSYTEQSGYYALIDRLCHFEIRLNWQSISGGIGYIRIPLPVARHSNTANGGPAIAVLTGLSTSPPIYACYSGFNNIGFRDADGNEISVSDLEPEGVIALSGTYIIGG